MFKGHCPLIIPGKLNDAVPSDAMAIFHERSPSSFVIPNTWPASDVKLKNDIFRIVRRRAAANYDKHRKCEIVSLVSRKFRRASPGTLEEI